MFMSESQVRRCNVYLRHKFLGNVGADEASTTTDTDSDDTIRTNLLRVGRFEVLSEVSSHVLDCVV